MKAALNGREPPDNRGVFKSPGRETEKEREQENVSVCVRERKKESEREKRSELTERRKEE